MEALCHSIRSGKPPFPLVKSLAADELEYVTRWLDFYQAGKSEDAVSNKGEEKRKG